MASNAWFNSQWHNDDWYNQNWFVQPSFTVYDLSHGHDLQTVVLTRTGGELINPFFQWVGDSTNKLLFSISFRKAPDFALNIGALNHGHTLSQSGLRRETTIIILDNPNSIEIGAGWETIPQETTIVGFGRNATGGEGGTVLTVTNLNFDGAGSLRDQLRQAQTIGPIVVNFAVNGVIPVEDEIDIYSNTTIDGRGADITLDGNNGTSSSILRCNGRDNVIIRNLKLTDARDIDALQIQGSTNLWVDHCSFTRAIDELIDFGGGSQNITISWCYLHNPLETGVSGGRGILVTNNAADDTVDGMTVHHCWFDDVYFRHPRSRHARIHLFNNLHTWGFAGTVSSEFAETAIENSIYDAAGSLQPTFAYRGIADGSDPNAGYLRATGLLLENGAGGNENAPGLVFDPSAIYSYTLDTADAALRTAIETGAGWQP